jgi:hypothetical protein
MPQQRQADTVARIEHRSTSDGSHQHLGSSPTSFLPLTPRSINVLGVPPDTAQAP